jgi:small-conductance mechanosensitive channel
MIFGSPAFTLFHVALSLVGIVTGLVVVRGLIRNDPLDGWTLWFLVTTTATTLTGFLFPFKGFTPAIGTGIVSTLVLAATIPARYAFHLAGAWRRIYVIGAVISLYLNCFVLVVQAFLKVPALHALAPEGKEPPFAIAQGIVLVLAVVSGYLAARRFQPVSTQPALAPG